MDVFVTVRESEDWGLRGFLEHEVSNARVPDPEGDGILADRSVDPILLVHPVTMAAFAVPQFPREPHHIAADLTED
jgi:hypothetical protein